MKFGQLIECNMGNIFPGKSHTECKFKIEIEHISGSIVSNFIQFVFVVF